MNEEQYGLVFARRLHQDNMVWQTPSLATAAVAFLLAVAFNPDTGPNVSTLLSAFSLVVSAASIHLMAKHRHLEVEDSERLLQYEIANAASGYEPLHDPSQRVPNIRRSWFVSWSAFWIWIWILLGLCTISGYGAYAAFERAHSSPATAQAKSSAATGNPAP